MDKPSFVSLQVINTCNLRCVQCDYHQEHLGESRLSIEEQCELVRQIGAWDRNIRLKITGGEPFLEKDRLFAVLEQGAGKGLTTFFLTNATLIEPDDIRRMLDLGLGCISVSLDSHNPAVHDAMRGSPGVWHKVERFLREFTAMRSQRGAGTKLWASTILTRQNLDCLEELVIAYEELGFDAIKFQPLFPNYRRQYSEGWKQASPLYPTRDEVEHGFSQLTALRERHPILDQSTDHIQKMRRYLLDDVGSDSILCDIMNKVMIVDCDGNVRFCFQQDPKMQFCTVMPECEPNVRQRGLQDIWEQSAPLRARMQHECHRPCSLLWDRVRDIPR